ncbi:putative xyloglucan 6-xylosyltransferase 5 [Nicotiana tabacum]|uniref:Xyloglucan 6-xylosyltransferase 5 n=1 Tax=Nicotiana tabacum TaxID=4097 RepID=A0A1S4BEC5_TOBAC|nr:PREDICTED: probable xyloglucan 6-xylosyltransferase 5 [Nicotiana tabacum]
MYNSFSCFQLCIISLIPKMVQFTALKRLTSAGVGATLPTSTKNGGASARSASAGLLRRRRVANSFGNLKLTILCGIVTILVLRGTIGLTNFSSNSSSLDQTQELIEETNRVIAEIRSDSDDDDNNDEDDHSEFSHNASYTLGPKITNWDFTRKAWLHENPRFPSYVNGKPRVLLVTGSPPSPCDNSIGDHYLLKSIKNKIDYCRIHNIEIVYNMAHLDNQLSGYWSKLPLIRKLMISHPEIEWIWWMDSDAMFTDMTFEIPLSKYDGKNLIIHGYPELLNEKSWVALNTGSFLLRNCQWSLDLLDSWAPMGPKGKIRDDAGEILTANLKGRPNFEADDQSALIYLLISQNNKWMEKVFIESSYYLHGYWAGLVDRYEEMIEKYKPGFGDERWPFVTHFVGCKSCGSYGDYPVEKCLKSMERAFNFADNQVLKLYGFRHRGLSSPNIKRIRNETFRPLEFVGQFDIRHSALIGSL